MGVVGHRFFLSPDWAPPPLGSFQCHEGFHRNSLLLPLELQGKPRTRVRETKNHFQNSCYMAVGVKGHFFTMIIFWFDQTFHAVPHVRTPWWHWNFWINMTCNDKVTTKLVAKFKAVVTHYKATTSDEPNWFVVQFGNAIDTLAGDCLKQIPKFCRYIHLIYLDILAPGSWVPAPSSDCTKNFMTGWTLFCWEGSLKRKNVFFCGSWKCMNMLFWKWQGKIPSGLFVRRRSQSFALFPVLPGDSHFFPQVYSYVVYYWKKHVFALW